MKFKVPNLLIMKIFTVFVNKIKFLDRIYWISIFIMLRILFLLHYLVLEILTFLFKLLCNSTVFLPAPILPYYSRLLFLICMCLSSELSLSLTIIMVCSNSVYENDSPPHPYLQSKRHFSLLKPCGYKQVLGIVSWMPPLKSQWWHDQRTLHLSLCGYLLLLTSLALSLMLLFAH